MHANKSFKQVTSYESCGSAGDVGVKVMVCLARDLTEREKDEVDKFAYRFHRLMVNESIRLDPEEQRLAAEEKRAMLALFEPHAPVYIEEIPNGYASDNSRPWYVVTTRIGRIKIGWRYRVISIDWEDSTLKDSAEDRFPGEDVTKDGRLIHAWGYEKAAEYLATILNKIT